MQLSKEAIEKFKEAYQKDFGEPVSDDEAKEMAVRLLRFVHIIYKPIPEDKKEYMKKIVLEYRDYLKELCAKNIKDLKLNRSSFISCLFAISKAKSCSG